MTRPALVPSGQVKIVRPAFEASVKPGAIARQFRLSRAQVERLVSAMKRTVR